MARCGVQPRVVFFLRQKIRTWVLDHDLGRPLGVPMGSFLGPDGLSTGPAEVWLFGTVKMYFCHTARRPRPRRRPIAPAPRRRQPPAQGRPAVAAAALGHWLRGAPPA